MSAALSPLMLESLPLIRSGKVRDCYAWGDDLIFVASDRISAFDVVLPSSIPGKGAVLNQLSNFWFEQTQHIVPNHVIQAGLPPEVLTNHREWFEARSTVARKAERIDFECVVRGYLAGSGWKEYQQFGTLAGEPLPGGLLQCDRLPRPVFTPAMKNDAGHDENVSIARMQASIGAELAGQLAQMSIALYEFGSDHAARCGMLLADTKFEFGLIDGQLILIDEMLTPDSSRYWDASTYEPGHDQQSFDKQYVRNWLDSSGWDHEPPGPELPAEVVTGTQQRYFEAFERLTGKQPIF